VGSASDLTVPEPVAACASASEAVASASAAPSPPVVAAAAAAGSSFEHVEVSGSPAPPAVSAPAFADVQARTVIQAPTPTSMTGHSAGPVGGAVGVLSAAPAPVAAHALGVRREADGHRDLPRGLSATGLSDAMVAERKLRVVNALRSSLASLLPRSCEGSAEGRAGAATGPTKTITYVPSKMGAQRCVCGVRASSG
jgi:hypothetical protein